MKILQRQNENNDFSELFNLLPCNNKPFSLHVHELNVTPMCVQINTGTIITNTLHNWVYVPV